MARRLQFSLPDLLAAVLTAAVCGALSVPLLSDRFFPSFENFPQLVAAPISLAVAITGLLVLMAFKSPEFGRFQRWMGFAGVALITWWIACAICYSCSNSRMAFNESRVAIFCYHFAEAEKYYYTNNHNSDGTLEYARSLEKLSVNSPKTITPAEVKAEVLPGNTPVPYKGYYFKMLFEIHERVGRISLISEGGHMTKGYAMIAYPAEYKRTGIRSFFVSNPGTVQEIDLGPDTQKIVNEMTAFEGKSWWIE